MNFTRVFVDSIGYELAPVVVDSEELEEHLDSLYNKLHIPRGQLESLTGIEERRWWEPGQTLAEGAVAAGRKALNESTVPAEEIGALLYTGVGRDHFEPATACRVAAELGVGGQAIIHDISNACLGMLSGMLDIANRIELGQIRAGLVVASETAREIVEEAMARMLAEGTMEFYISSLATLTGGSGAAAILLTDGSFGAGHRLLGGEVMAAPQHHGLCRWGMEEAGDRLYREWMRTDAVGVLTHGVALGVRTWEAFIDRMGWSVETIDRVICHQVGEANRNTVLTAMKLPPEKDFPTYPFLGNMGTVSLPITAAIAAERGFLQSGHRVGFLGIGSGLNCMMLGLEW